MKTDSVRKVLPLTNNMTESASISRPVPSPKHAVPHVIRSGSVPRRNESISSAQTLTLDFEISMLSPIIGDLTPKTMTLDTLLCDKKADDPLFKDIIKKLKDLPLDSKVTLHTIVFSPENNHSQNAVLNLVEVTINGEKRFYEASKEGGRYKSIDAFIKENEFGPGQYLYYNQNNSRQEAFVRNSTPLEKVKPILDAGVLLVTGVALGVVLVTPARSAAAPFVFPPAEAALRYSGIYFGVNGALEVKDDLDHGRFTLSTVGNAGMVVATALPFGGAAVRLFKSAEALAKAETKTEKVLKAVVTFSQLTGVAGNVTAIGAFTLEQALAMQEISGTKDTSDSEKKKMLLQATAQMLVNTGLIFLSHKGSKKITQFKNGQLPEHALPNAKNKLAVDKILHSYYEKLWQKTLKGKEATVSAIKSFHEKGGAGAKEYLSRLYELTNVKIKQLKDSAQSNAKQSLKALKYSLILFSHQSQIPLVAEEISLSMATADGFKVPVPSLWKLRVPNQQEIREANAFLSKSSKKAAPAPVTAAPPPVLIQFPAENVFILKNLDYPPGLPTRKEIGKIFGNDTSWTKYLKPTKVGIYDFKSHAQIFRGTTSPSKARILAEIKSDFSSQTLITKDDVVNTFSRIKSTTNYTNWTQLISTYFSVSQVEPMTVKVIKSLKVNNSKSIRDNDIDLVFDRDLKDVNLRRFKENADLEISRQNLDPDVKKALLEAYYNRIISFKLIGDEIAIRNLPDPARKLLLDLQFRKPQPNVTEKRKALEDWFRISQSRKTGSQLWDNVQPETVYVIKLEGGGELKIKFKRDLLQELKDPSNDILAKKFYASVCNTVGSKHLAAPKGENKIKGPLEGFTVPTYEIKIGKAGGKRIFGEEIDSVVYFHTLGNHL